MSSNEIILNWLNSDLKFQPNIKDITKEFSNGYKYAELLHILNEISLKEFEQFKNSNNLEEIKENFNKLKIIFHDKLHLDIREEEFNDVINHKIATATIILYKIKNSMNKKKINFLNIKTFSNNPTIEEINNKVREILDNESKEIDKEEDLDLVKKSSKNDRYYIKKLTQNSRDLNSIQSDSKEAIESDKNIEYKDSEILGKISGNLNINIDNSNMSNKFNIKQKSLFNFGDHKNIFKSLSNTIKTINTNNIFESKKEFNAMETMKFNTINNLNNSGNKKKIIKPFSGNFNFKNINVLPKINIQQRIQPRITGNTNLEYKSSIMNSNLGSLSNNSIFNKKLKTLSAAKAFDLDESDFNNDFGMTKIKELKNKNQKKLEDIKRLYKIKNELKLKKEYDVKEKYQLDFINKIKNPLYKFTKFTGVNLFMHSNSKYNSCNKRLEYSKELKEKIHKEELSQQICQIKKIMSNNTGMINLKLKDKFKNLNNLSPFNKIAYFKKLNDLNKEEFNNSLIQKYGKEKTVYPLMKKVIYSIIELMEDIYDYQDENEKEEIELEDFKIFCELFIKDKHKEKAIFDDEDMQIKDPDYKDEIKIDINNLILKEDEIYLIQDYINYIGIWNDEKIINNELKGYKFDIKKIKSDLPLDYEPTENEIEDITLPIKISDNYILGNTLLNIIETKYSNNKDTIGKNSELIIKENNNINKENNNLSKWNYIPYKLSFIGYPLSGRKFIAENLIKKYPNIKIYSIKQLLRNYYLEYKNMTEKIDGNPKYKSLKPNQILQMKEEREKQLSDFTPILNIIKPFIDFINSERKRKKMEKENKILDINKSLKSPKRRGSISKKRKSIVIEKEKEEEYIEENINDDLKIIPQDEILFNLLVYTIEKDFPQKSKEESDKEIIENQTKIFQILKNIETLEKQKKEAAKPNPKDDITINNLKKDLENIKLDSIKGFILVDYPCNINQSILLENYLTGYVDEMQKPKSEKNKIINNLANFLDFKIMPKKNNIFKRSGIDFVINIINQEKDIDERFENKKYDPISDKIYTNSDLNEQNKYKQPLDKKIVERLVNDIPYLSKENFEYYKNEYNNNISLICQLYNKFGMYVDVNTSQESQINILGIEFSEKELKKAFQSIELDTKINTNIKENENTINSEKKQISPKKNIEKRASISRKSFIKKTIKNDEAIFELEESFKNKILDFISNNIINWLYKEKEKSDKIIFYSIHPEYNTDEENDRIKFDPELKVNEINNDKTKKTIKHQTNNASTVMGESIITTLLNKNSEYVIKELNNFNSKYYKYLGNFICLLNSQKNSIYQRLNLIQKKFRDFLNHETNKKKVIHIYVKKYNEFFRDKQHFFNSNKAIEEFSEDIEQVNNNLWILINEKEKESIKELDSIKNCGFIEKELTKFYENIKELFLLETEKFLIMVNSIIYLYSNGNKNINLFEKEENRNSLFRNNKRENELNNKLNNNIDHQNNEKELNKMFFDKYYLIKNISDIKFDTNKIANSFNDKPFKNTSQKENNNELLINNFISDILINIEEIFMNGIKLIIEYQGIIGKLTKEIKSTSPFSHKKYFKKKATKYNISMSNSSMMTSMYSGETQINEKIIKMLQNEKNKYKYRMCYLKSFVYKYIAIIIQTAQNIYNNLDQWIVTSVSLQNDSLNMIISILKNKLKSHRLINEKKEINIIEMDKFEKIINENEEGGSELGIKPIDNSSVGIGRIYNKINIDYLINDNFIDLKVEEIFNINQKEEKENKKDRKKIKNLKYKIIFPNELDKSINSSINNSFGAGIKNRFKEFDFYFDINKFNSVYKNIKKYEIEENIINKDLFFEIFIKQYLIDKYDENGEKENINLGIKNKRSSIEKINNKSNNAKNNISDESEEEEEDDNINNNQSNFHNLNAICTALKMLNSKQYNKIYQLYQIPIVHKNELKNEHKENLKENNNKNNDNNENREKEMTNTKIEYDIYLNTSEIFTILPLIGCKIMNRMEEEKIFSDLKEKLIRGKYLTKNDFMEYHFWFEQEFEYQNEDIMFQQILEENNNNRSFKKKNLSLESSNKNKKLNIKEFLFNIWKDDKGDKIDFLQFISVLKINKYITDLNSLNEGNYYSIIFKSES